MKCTDCKCTTKSNASIVIKFACEPETTSECPVCKRRFYIAGRTWAYLENTTTPVCLNCAGAELAALLETIRRQDEKIDNALETIRAEKLMHYSRRDPMLFFQVDAFMGAPEDGSMGPDDQGFAIYGNRGTWELMLGSDVRVLIRSTITKDEAERGLAEISRTISEGFVDEALEKDLQAEALEHAEMLQRHDADSIPF